MNVFEDLTIDHAYNVHNSQCSAADCVLIFLRLISVCVGQCSVRLAQRRHQTILM